MPRRTAVVRRSRSTIGVVVAARAHPGSRFTCSTATARCTLTVDPGRTVIVRGYLGEPMIRFADGLVSVNRASPTANADRIASGGSGWATVVHGRTYVWHDHRLAPPPRRGEGPAGIWSVPLTIDGRRAEIAGTFWHVSPAQPAAVAARRGCGRSRSGGGRRPTAR